MSFSDQAQTILRQLPTLWATTGLKLRTITTAPGVSPLGYSAWSALVGFFKEGSNAQAHDANDNAYHLTRMAHVTTRDDVSLKEGDQVMILTTSGNLLLESGGVILNEDGTKLLLETGQATIWNISGEAEPHRKSLGFIIYAAIRSEMQQAGVARGGGR